MNQDLKERIESFKKFSDRPLDKITHIITTSLCMITQSTISYFATVNPKQDVLTMTGWSQSAMTNCALINKPIVYKLNETGLWGDAIREKKPVISNDYKNLVKPTKKGYPKGHVDVRKHMNLPIYENGLIVLVAGVGNKKDDYTLEDAKNVEAFMDEVWKVLKVKL
jgi:hypothetical protein